MKRFNEIPKNDGQFTLAQVATDVGLIQTRSQFIPGRFYSVKIRPEYAILDEAIVPAINDDKDYYDINPCGLSIFHENWKETALILNLKVIPPQICAKLLEAYYALASQNGLSDLFREGTLIPLHERRSLDKRFYGITTSNLSQVVGINNLNYAINKYNIDQIAEARLIDWDNFGLLVRPTIAQYAMFPETINLAQIFENFIPKSI